jgi:hypothetical protein
MVAAEAASRETAARARQFFLAVRERHAAAAKQAGLHQNFFRIGDRVAHLHFAGPALERILSPALEHLKAAPDEPSSLKVFLFDSASTGVLPPAPAWGLDAYGVRGDIEGFNTGSIRTLYQPGADVLLMLDRERSEAIYWLADHRKLPYWECSFPLRTIFHWWLEDLPFQPVHAAAVGLQDGGVLIAGRSGSGKSTSALACLNSQLMYAGDDYVLVRHNPALAYSLYGTAKLVSDNLARFPGLAPLVANPERLPDEKALIFVNSHMPEKIGLSFPIRALLVPRISGRRDTVLRRASAAEAFRALAPTTLFQLQGGERRTLAKIGALVEEVPAYTLEAGTDLSQIPERILALLRNGSAQ